MDVVSKIEFFPNALFVRLKIYLIITFFFNLVGQLPKNVKIGILNFFFFNTENNFGNKITATHSMKHRMKVQFLLGSYVMFLKSLNAQGSRPGSCNFQALTGVHFEQDSNCEPLPATTMAATHGKPCRYPFLAAGRYLP